MMATVLDRTVQAVHPHARSRTRAPEPLERTAAWDEGEAPETYPSGLCSSGPIAPATAWRQASTRWR
jgi:hypothetical protein